MPTPGKRSSMRQIAAAAGVSVATVSHVINGSGRFSEDTRERVEAAVRHQRRGGAAARDHRAALEHLAHQQAPPVILLSISSSV